MQNDHNIIYRKSRTWLIFGTIALLTFLLLVGKCVMGQFSKDYSLSPSKNLIDPAKDGKIDRLVTSNVISFRDTVYIHDTLRIPIYHYQSSDTIQAAFLLKGDRLISGFIIYSGFKVQTSKGLQWSAEPVASGFLDRKRRVIDRKKIVKAF